MVLQLQYLQPCDMFVRIDSRGLASRHRLISALHRYGRLVEPKADEEVVPGGPKAACVQFYSTVGHNGTLAEWTELASCVPKHGPTDKSRVACNGLSVI